MERQRGVPDSGWNKDGNTNYSGSQAKRTSQNRQHIRRGDHRPTREGSPYDNRAGFQPPINAESGATFPPAPPGRPHRKPIKRPSNVYRFEKKRASQNDTEADPGLSDTESADYEARFGAYSDTFHDHTPADGPENTQCGDPQEGNYNLHDPQPGTHPDQQAQVPPTVQESAAPYSAGPSPQAPAQAWQDHPITKALSALNQPGSPLNPAQIIADSLLPPEMRARQPHQPTDWDDMPIRPIEPGLEKAADVAAAEIDARDAFWDFWLTHQDQMRKQCLRLMSGNVADAEDALSNAMLRASQKFPSYADSIVNGKAWLRKLVYNVCMDHYRQGKMTENRAFDQDSDIPSSGAMFTEKPQSPEEKAMSKEQIKALDEGIENLSSNLRVPLYLRCVEGWSYPDIADELNIRADTVRKRIQLARDHLRRNNIR